MDARRFALSGQCCGHQSRDLGVGTSVTGMSNFGFGFGAGSGGDPDDLSGKIPLFAELQRLLSGSGGPVNWDLARQLAISNLSASHRSVSAADSAAVTSALRLADVWLDGVTDLPSGMTETQAWNQVEWVEKTITTWAAVCDPVAGRVVSAMSSALPPEIAAQAGPMAPMLNQFGGLMFGAQLGQGLAALAGEVVSASDIGLPLGPAATGALVVGNLESLASDLERPLDEVRLFVALREAAHHRLFTHVPWLKQQLIEAVDAYGRGIVIDPQAITNAMNEIDPANPESLQTALSSGLFEPQTTESQELALRRLETLLALIEGWVDTVVVAAATDRLQATAALSEAIRRRRATGGPAEQTFATLVGLELRPRRLREAATLWKGVTERQGVSARDQIWNHPDLLPRGEDLDDPIGFADRHASMTDFDESAMDELTRLLSESPAVKDDHAAKSDGEAAADPKAASAQADSTAEAGSQTGSESSSESASESGSGPDESHDDKPGS